MRFETVRLRTRLAATRLAIACLAIVLLGASPWAIPGAKAQSAQTGIDGCPAAAKPADNPHIGSSTCLPIPRFVSLRADAVNLRVGPGDQYPIQWVYHRAGLPVEVLREFDVWRLVVDADGTEGWMHEATLVGARHFVINASSPVTLFRSPSDQSNPAAQLMPGVIGLILRCDAGAAWCRVRVDHIGGWLERADFWGTFPAEAIPAK
jgi:SH3-like domain-containing protein